MKRTKESTFYNRELASRYQITNQRDLRCAFWEAHPQADRRRIKDYAGTGRMYRTDTRVAFVDWIDSLCRNGTISQALAHRATLD